MLTFGWLAIAVICACQLRWLKIVSRTIMPCLKLKLRVFLVGHSVAMVTYCVTKIIPTCSPVIGHFFDTMIAALIKSGYNDPSKSKSLNVLETVLSHLR